MCLWVSYKNKYEGKIFFFILQVTEERSRIRSWFRILSGSISQRYECHGSPTLVVRYRYHYISTQASGEPKQTVRYGYRIIHGWSKPRKKSAPSRRLWSSRWKQAWRIGYYPQMVKDGSVNIENTVKKFSINGIPASVAYLNIDFNEGTIIT